MFEQQRDPECARQEWGKALELLPPDSKQASWILAHLRKADVVQAAPARSQETKWAGRLAPLAPLVAMLGKGKALLAIFKLNFIFSLGAFLAVYWSLYGMKFALGFTVQIVLHEFGHYVDIKRRGLRADLPVFLPGMGAFVRWQAMGVPIETRAAISLAGPFAGLLAAGACALMWIQTGSDFWAALARTGAWLNLMNLIPIWALDGGQAFLALTKRQRGILLAFCFVLFLIVEESMLLLIALGVTWRLFTRDFPENPSLNTALYFAAVLLGLSGLLWVLPGRGFGVP